MLKLESSHKHSYIISQKLILIYKIFISTEIFLILKIKGNICMTSMA